MSTGDDDPWRALSARTIFLHQAIADRLGLNITDHKCLDILVRQGAMTAGRLAQESGLTTGAITGVVDRLEKRGFARRAADDRDRRKTLVVPQTDAMGEVADLFAELARRMEATMASYTPEQRITI